MLVDHRTFAALGDGLCTAFDVSNFVERLIRNHGVAVFGSGEFFVPGRDVDRDLHGAVGPASTNCFENCLADRDESAADCVGVHAGDRIRDFVDFKHGGGGDDVSDRDGGDKEV